MMKKSFLKKCLITSVSILILMQASVVQANPEGGQVTDGIATMEASGKKLDIHQKTDRVVID